MPEGGYTREDTNNPLTCRQKPAMSAPINRFSAILDQGELEALKAHYIALAKWTGNQGGNRDAEIYRAVGIQIDAQLEHLRNTSKAQ